jgi:TolB-like protein
MRTLRFLVLAGLLWMPAQTAAQQADKPTVAIIPFGGSSVARGVDGPSIGRAVTDMVVTEFAKSSKIRLVDRAMVEDLLTKQKLIVSGRVSDEGAMQAGKLLGAQYIVAGSVFLAGTTARLDIRIVDPETGAFPKPPFKESGKQDDLIDLVEKLVAHFTSDLKLPNRATVIAEQMIPVGASLAFSRGLDYEKRGKKDLAAKQFAKALELSPNHAQAKAALERVR